MPQSERKLFLTAVRRYADLIEPKLEIPSGFTPSEESDSAVQVERALMFPMVVRTATPPSEFAERLVELATSARLPGMDVVDRLGHQRPVYRPLLVYSWLMTYRLQFETLPRMEFARWDEALRAWCDVLADSLSQFHLPGTGIPAASGALASSAAWSALALRVAGSLFIRDPWTDLAAGVMGQLSRAQQPSGAFLMASASDHPETRWYYELCILHAAASFAVQAEDRTVANAVARATTYHLNETQPDHATTQPWGLFAFIWNTQTHSLADQMLHSVELHPREGEAPAEPRLSSQLDPLSLILLADCLYSLRLFL
jgi:hypothetical protein